MEMLSVNPLTHTYPHVFINNYCILPNKLMKTKLHKVATLKTREQNRLRFITRITADIIAYFSADCPKRLDKMRHFLTAFYCNRTIVSYSSYIHFERKMPSGDKTVASHKNMTVDEMFGAINVSF